MFRLHFWTTTIFVATCIAIYLSGGDPSVTTNTQPVGPSSTSLQTLGVGQGLVQQWLYRLFEGQTSSLLTTLGGVVVFVLYYVRFSQWAEPSKLRLRDKPTRHFTSGTRYILFACLYALTFLCIYFILVGIPELAAAIAKYLPADLPSTFRNAIGDLGTGSNVALYVVIILLLAPQVRSLQEYRFRNYMQRLAFIPGQANVLCKRIESNPEWFLPEQAVIEKVLATPRSDTLLFPEDFGVSGTVAVRAAYAKACYFSDRMSEGFQSPDLYYHYKDEIEYCGEHVQKLEQAIDKLHRDYVSQYRALKPDEAKELSDREIWRKFKPAELGNEGTVLAHEAGAILEKTNALLSEIYEIIVCALLAQERFPQERSQMFGAMGIALPKDPVVALDGNTLIGSALSLAIAIGVPTLAYFVMKPLFVETRLSLALAPKTLGAASFWAGSGVLMHLGAIMAAILVKRAVEINRPRAAGQGIWHRRFPDYWQASMMSFCVAVWTMAGLTALDPRTSSTLGQLWPWALIPVITGAAVAFYIDSYWKLRLERLAPGRRTFLTVLSGPALQGIATALVALLVSLSILETLSDQFKLKFLSPSFFHEAWPFLVYVGIATLLVGAFVGYWFPKLYARQMIASPEHARQRQDPKDRLNPRQRLYDRAQQSLAGRWISSDGTFDVVTRNLSPTGAALDQRLDQPIGASGTLELTDIGYFPARVVRHDEDITGLEFQFEVPQQKLLQNLRRAA